MSLTCKEVRDILWFLVLSLLIYLLEILLLMLCDQQTNTNLCLQDLHGDTQSIYQICYLLNSQECVGEENNQENYRTAKHTCQGNLPLLHPSRQAMESWWPLPLAAAPCPPPTCRPSAPLVSGGHTVILQCQSHIPVCSWPSVSWVLVSHRTLFFGHTLLSRDSHWRQGSIYCPILCLNNL